ncbi:uncharacterized protein Dmoj_GI26453 [Drosophila mojavensis]|uniref:Uncharacterized protein n=1 Tax=Drosophila mojavensis TaxID=7230 RepID=A0A0Q9XAT2_DROMO|nr:uncharacterized protein Dmoj_GI26453 [Drosophila mojavensis]
MILDKCVGKNLLLLLFTVLGNCESKRRWTYEFLYAEGFSDNEAKLKPDLRIQRVGRYQVGVSGTIDWQYDIDRTTMFELIIFQSPSGNLKEFRKLPFTIPKQIFINMRKYYDEIAMADARNCTNLPNFEGNVLLPWPRGLYVFDMCTADNGNYPDILAEGLYKFIFAFSGEVVWNVSFYVNIKTKIL